MLHGIKIIESSFVWFHRIIDSVLPISILFAITNAYPVQWQDHYIITGVLGGLLFILSAQSVGVYDNWRGLSYFSSIKLILSSWILTWMALIVLAFLYKDTSSFSRIVISSWGLLTPLTLISYRLLIRSSLASYRQHTNHATNIGIAGAGKVGQHIANIIQTNKWLGYNITAYFDDAPELLNTEINGVPIIGNLDTIVQAANNNIIDELYICLPLRAELKIKRLLNQLTDTTAIVKYIPDLFTFDLMHAKWTEINGVPIISVFDTPLSGKTAQLIKRTEDIILSIIRLIMISPVLIAVALGVKLSSPGPVLFKQNRYGINGQPINVYKFRSMTSQDNGNIIKQATKKDIRITAFGAFIRKTSLDELPQFYNVIQGRMSIVGPRPHAVAHNEEYRKLIPKYMQRHLVKPGITGWAQINGWRGETDTLHKMKKRIDFDLHYINTWSLWLDIKIIILTTVKGFINKNAY